MAALYAVLLNLKADGDAIISPTQGHHAYGLFMALIRRSSLSMADELHASDSMKPFTISPLQGKFQRAVKSLKVIGDYEYSIRLTFLEEDVFAYFMDATLKAVSQPLRLESAIFHIDHIILHHEDSPFCRHQSYQELLTESQPVRKMSLQFLSPTAFRSGGKRNVLFPEASLAFGSYLSKWQHFSPIKVDEHTAEFLEQIIVTRYKLSTRILHFNGYQETGFQGECTFELPADSDEDSLKTINALADFAFYCGTGAKTTMGMGQTRRITRGLGQQKPPAP
jgi:CRISPR-associated endoribonuclease Cas6